MNKAFRKIFFTFTDLFALGISFLISINILNIQEESNRFRFYIIFLFIYFLLLFILQPHVDYVKRGYFVELIKTGHFVTINFLSSLLFIFLIGLNSQYSKQLIIKFYLLFFITTYLLRIFVKKIYRDISKKAVKKGDHSLLVVTTKANLSKYVDEVTSDNYEYYRICGLCVLDKDLKDEVINGIKVVANKDELLSYVCHNWVDDVLFGIPYNDVPSELLDGLSMAGISMMFELTNAKSLQGRSHEIKTLYDESILCSTVHPRNDFEIVIKRMMDIVGSLLGIIILGLLIIIIGPIIYLKSPGPIFYFQERVGKNGNIFKIYKFRSMVLNADELKDDLLKDNRIKDGMMFKVENDPRIIPGIGTFIRKTSIDEFPQFINVLKGEMSLVGTRPPTLDEWQKYNLGHRIRMTIKPGITGAWQTSGRSEITDFEEVLKMDREYINNWSISLDIKILIKTIYVIIFRKKDAM